MCIPILLIYHAGLVRDEPIYIIYYNIPKSKAKIYPNGTRIYIGYYYG